MSIILKLIILSSVFTFTTAFAANADKPEANPQASPVQSSTTAKTQAKGKVEIIELDKKPDIQAQSSKVVEPQVKPESKPQALNQQPQEPVQVKTQGSTTTIAPTAPVTAPVQNTASSTASATDMAAPTVDLKVVEFVLANQVVQREPKDVVENFAHGSEKAFAFARVNASVASEVTFVWYRNNQIYTQYTAPIQAAKTWRTFSSVKLKSGDWKVQLLGKNKEVLAEKTFTIQ